MLPDLHHDMKQGTVTCSPVREGGFIIGRKCIGHSHCSASLDHGHAVVHLLDELEGNVDAGGFDDVFYVGIALFLGTHLESTAFLQRGC